MVVIRLAYGIVALQVARIPVEFHCIICDCNYFFRRIGHLLSASGLGGGSRLATITWNLRRILGWPGRAVVSWTGYVFLVHYTSHMMLLFVCDASFG